MRNVTTKLAPSQNETRVENEMERHLIRTSYYDEEGNLIEKKWQTGLLFITTCVCRCVYVSPALCAHLNDFEFFKKRTKFLFKFTCVCVCVSVCVSKSHSVYFVIGRI